MNFLELEGAYIGIGIFILIIAAIVTTRSFVGKNAFKIGMPIVFVALTFFVCLHYYVTTDRMAGVEERFNEGLPVICENRIQRKTGQSVTMLKKLGWKLDKDIFTHPQYARGFHTARCIKLFNTR